MALADDLSMALKDAMKAKDKPKLDAIRQIQTEIAKKKSEKGEEVNDDLVLGVISSYVKKMIKAVEEYQSLGDRGQEMAEKIQFEIDFLRSYLPEQISEEEVEKIVDEVLSELGDVDISQMGRVIGAVMAKGDGIDGSVVSKIVKNKLS
ncbi:GatB/YqeY domain-containing protein [Acidimicrobiaceae bacterium]|nr:GatB/YqeY domain-containing protein [Acidimicrobiaceae bacterium]